MSSNLRPLISVVMCVYNPGAFLEPALQSVFGQTYDNWELIVSDDGSNDGTRERLRELESNPKVRLFFQEKNLGYVANKNFAHRQASGEYITQLDNDDTSSLNRLELQLDAIRRNPEVKIVACGYERIDAAGNGYGTVAPAQEGPILRKGDRDYPFWFPSLLVHRSVFELLGHYDPWFSGILGDDLYWTVRANRHFPIWCLTEPLYQYRNNPGSITNVLDNERKLIMPAVLDELIRQQERDGTDWLQQGREDTLDAHQAKLLRDPDFMAEQYRIWAAKAIDKRDWRQAAGLLRRSFRRKAINPMLARTAIYYLRQRFLK